MVFARHGLPDGTATAEKSDASRQGNRETVPRAFVDRVALPNGMRLSCGQRARRALQVER